MGVSLVAVKIYFGMVRAVEISVQDMNLMNVRKELTVGSV
jgi:hypothetical protein